MKKKHLTGKIPAVALAILVCCFFGCDNGTSADPSPTPTPEATATATATATGDATLTYTLASATYTVGTAITENDATCASCGTPTFTVMPALPAGLSLNSSTGVISGTPLSAKESASYVITATHDSVETTATITIVVNDVAPAQLSYSASTIVYLKGVALTSSTQLTPTNDGGSVVSYAVSPALPTGLSLDTNTGIIAGTPTEATASASYVVTATNSGGSTTATLSIAVVSTWGTSVAGPENATTNVKHYKAVVGSLGNVFAVWLQDVGGSDHVYAAVYGSGSWGTPVKLDTQTATIEDVFITIDSNNTVMTAWKQQQDGGANYLYYSKYSSGSWSTADKVSTSTSPTPSTLYEMITEPTSGKTLVFWVNSSSELYTNAYTSGGGWGANRKIADTFIRGVHAGYDSSGNVFAVIAKLINSSDEAYSLTYTTGNDTWSTPAVVDASRSATASSFDLTVSPNGKAILAYVVGALPVVSTSSTSTGTWTSPTELDTASSTSTVLSVASDSSGNGILTWSHNSEIYSKLYDTTSGWGASTKVSSSLGTGVTNENPRVKMDSSGNAALTWLGSSDGSYAVWRLYSTRYIKSSGWTIAGAVESGSATVSYTRNTSPPTYFPFFAMNSSGVGCLLWSYSDGSVENIWYSFL